MTKKRQYIKSGKYRSIDSQLLAERKQEQNQQRDAAIINAAFNLAKKGVKYVTMRAIATEIKYSLPVIYFHYPNGEKEILAKVLPMVLNDLPSDQARIDYFLKDLIEKKE